MYGLRNAWKGIKNASSNPAKVRRAQKDAMKFGSAEEAKAAKAKWSLAKRTGEKLEDFAYGSKNLLFSQATEGVEEAINTIASKEGIHYGRTLLDKEDKVFDIEKEGIIKKFLEENYVIDSYEIKTSNNGFVVDVKGRVIVKNKYITSLTNELFEFGEVR